MAITVTGLTPTPASSTSDRKSVDPPLTPPYEGGELRSVDPPLTPPYEGGELRSEVPPLTPPYEGGELREAFEQGKIPAQSTTPQPQPKSTTLPSRDSATQTLGDRAGTNPEPVEIGISYLPHMDLGASQATPSPTQSQNSPSSIILATTSSSPTVPPTPSASKQPLVSPVVRATGNTNMLVQAAPTANPQTPSSVQTTSALDNLNPSANPLLYPTKPEEVQVQPTQPITLQQALTLAQRNNRDLQTTRLTLERDQAALRQAQAAEYPTLGLQTPAQLSQTFAQQGRGWPTLNAALQLNYNVYTSGRTSGLIREAEEQVRFDELDVERQSSQTNLDITTAYYNLQLAGAQVQIGLASLREAQRSLRDAQLLERAGLGTQFDILQAEVVVANANQTLATARSQQQSTGRQLVQLLNLAQTVELSAADPITAAGSWPLSLPQSIILALQNRAELQQQLAQRNIHIQQERVELASERPQVNVFANYNFQDVFDGSGNGPIVNLAVGAGVTWNFYDGGSARAAAAQQRVNAALAENQFANTRNQIRLQVEQAYFTINSSSQNIRTSLLALQDATRSLQLARLRFNAGVGTQTDVINAESALDTARANQVQAIINYNQALASLQRAVSSFPPRTLANRG